MISKNKLFKRQITLAAVGVSGQDKLQKTTVLVVGCGGLGSYVAVNLVASGIGHIHLVDFDTVSISNLHRQVFYTLEDVGKPKAQVLASFLKKRAPFTRISISNLPINKSNVFSLLNTYDIVVDGTDSLPTKYLLNDACVLTNKPLVYGSLYKFDGYVAVFNVLENNGKRSPNLRDVFPKILTDVPNCEEVGTLNAIVSTIASLQVNEVLKWVLKLDTILVRQLLIYNGLQNTQLKIKLENRVFKEDIKQIFEHENYYDANCEIKNTSWLITADALKNELSTVEIISVLINKYDAYPFRIHKKIPFPKLATSNFVPQKNKKYVIVCLQGNASYTATKFLKEKYPKSQIFSLLGGITNFS